MNRRVVFLKEANADISEALSWYRNIGLEIEENFKADLLDLFPILQENPYIFREVIPGIRMGLTRRFKYRVVYKVDEKEILIVAILHSKRHERKWRQRIRHKKD